MVLASATGHTLGRVDFGPLDGSQSRFAHVRWLCAQVGFATYPLISTNVEGMMATMKRISIGTLVSLTCAMMLGQQPRANKAADHCKNNAYLVGQCFRLHGRAFFSNGTPSLRIWHVGTKRILGVSAHPEADDAEDPIAPANLLSALGASIILYLEILRSVPSRLNARATCRWSAWNEQKILCSNRMVRNERLALNRHFISDRGCE